jgi:hypothetical protein
LPATLAHVPDKVGDEVVMVAPEALLELNGLATSVCHVLCGQRKPQLSLQFRERSAHGEYAETSTMQRQEKQQKLKTRRGGGLGTRD